MQKVISIKFLRAEWSSTIINNECDSKIGIQQAFDKALTELESKISEYLKNGWVMKGEISYPQYVKFNSYTNATTYLLQTMVKYEEPKVEDLLDL